SHFWYFHILDLPSTSHSIVVATRFSFVASVFASTIHSIYSLRCEGENPSNAAFAALFFFSAAASSGGTGNSGLGAFFATGFFTPFSFSEAPSFRYAMMILSAGRSFSEVIRSKCPMAFLSFTCRIPFGSFSKGAFQSPKEQCCLKAAILQSIEPLFSKKGIPHLIVSVASGQALCTRLRKWFRMGLAKSADLAIYASMRLSV